MTAPTWDVSQDTSQPAPPPTPRAAAARAASDASARSGAVRVGCDVQSVDPVTHAVRHFGARYLDRVYSAAEQADCHAGGPTSLAGRFAAKEAVLKLLGSADGIDPRTVEIVNHGARPSVRLSGSAARLAHRTGVGAIDVSISHDAGLAFAVAVSGPPTSSILPASPASTRTTTPPHPPTGDPR